MLTALIPIFIFTPLVELALLIEVGQRIGTLPAVLIVVATGALGAILAQWQGARVWKSLQEDLQALKMPTDKIIEGALVLVGGVLLITPGLLTDVIGFLLVIPWSRTLVRELIKKRFERKIQRARFKVIG
ncbi:FxsA family protein [Patescibacteria group bacterium]|nr:FxsA family protein [Patescibacteria group bacterium]MBU4512197.1 FxsA family protein [Patescibacteria group bacterium]MCG2693454.1 FxsA family protein [Candidatus Parcubacteria bacterium]